MRSWSLAEELAVFAPTRLRVGVVAEETNKFVSLSLNSLDPLAPATPPPPHLLPPDPGDITLTYRDAWVQSRRNKYG